MKFFILFLFPILTFAETTLTIGSKNFTESVILGEVLRLSLKHEGIGVTHKAQFGGTRILWNALLSGDINLYPEYTGTIEEEILRTKSKDMDDLRSKLAPHGIGMSEKLGFNNTYALGMKKKRAIELNVSKISDLVRHPKLKFGFSEEFRNRQDGWPGLKENYNLPHRFVRGLDHDIAYRALESGDIDVTDLYSTDAEIGYYELITLEDDAGYFPRYDGVVLYRLDDVSKNEGIATVIAALGNQIGDEDMIAMNRSAKIQKIGPAKIAADFISTKFGKKVQHKRATREQRIWIRTQEHLKLVSISLLFAILFAVPIGVFACKHSLFGKFALTTVAAVQTIPALALLVILIRPLNLLGLSGIGDTPALIALFLYSLLPIVRNTHAGLNQIPTNFRETASVLGLSSATKLWKIELPLALPSILAGVKTAAVLNVGFATLGALIGAGGYGQPILTGIRLDDYGLILEGALPAMILAFVSQQAFDFLERVLVSPGLKK
jgi:osmoprotectant transport system permease protein